MGRVTYQIIPKELNHARKENAKQMKNQVTSQIGRITILYAWSVSIREVEDWVAYHTGRRFLQHRDPVVQMNVGRGKTEAVEKNKITWRDYIPVGMVSNESEEKING